MIVSLRKNSIFLACFVLLVALGLIRSSPIYGKIDFLLVDGRPWWPAWEQLIQETRQRGSSPIYTDYVTGYVLAGVFGEKTVVNVGDDKIPTLSIEKMETNHLPELRFLNPTLARTGRIDSTRCVVNLLGHQATWVPVETRHWHSALASTNTMYRFRNAPIRTTETVEEIKQTQFKNCTVYFPQYASPKKISTDERPLMLDTNVARL